MKIALTHPGRELWLRLKALVAAVSHWRIPVAKARRVVGRKHHRTIAFLELP